MSRTMISLEKDGVTFSYRTVGVITDGPRVLLYQVIGDDFWVLPGGRVELGESAAEALAREMQEEIGFEVQIGRLLWIAENFVVENGHRYHEIGLYFQVSLPPGCAWLTGTGPFCGLEETDEPPRPRLHFQWFPRQLSALQAAHVLPAFLRDGLTDLPPAPQLVMNTNLDLPGSAASR